MPDDRHEVSAASRSTVMAFVDGVRRRLQAAIALRALASGIAAFAALLMLARVASWPAPAALALLAGAGVAALVGAKTWRLSARTAVASLIERRTERFDNLLVAAEELHARPRPVSAPLADEIFRQAAERLRTVRSSDVVALRSPAMLAGTVTLGAWLVWFAPSRPLVAIDTPGGGGAADIPAAAGIASVVVQISPPAYTGMPERSETDPADVRLLEGSRVDITAVAPGVSAIDLVRPDGHAERLDVADGRHTGRLVADQTVFLLLRPAGVSAAAPRLLSLIVEPDRRPTVRIREPARDLAFPQPEGDIPLQIEAADDVGLASVELRYTHVTGSGETFTFKEGTLPLVVDRANAGSWKARGQMSLAALGMEVGDTLVYRAVAKDGKPGADPVASESFIVEIGAMAGVASAGFALPDDRERQAISQQMVIVKTERLDKARPTLTREAYEEQARLLAVEQRMVRAEFVFMTGGEVQDEVEEAAHSHDLTEGRFENEGQVELLTAIREMSRAEAALNGGDTAKALPLERAALAALQRAFDRRRYLLRTLPERARIDTSRRLTGERAEARSWTREPVRPDAPQVEQMGEVMRALAAGVRAPETVDVAPLAARVGSLAPADAEMQTVAVGLGKATTADDRRAAMEAAMRLIAARAARALSPPASVAVPADPIEGRFAVERVERGRR